MRSLMLDHMSAAWEEAIRLRWPLIGLTLVMLAAHAQSIATPMYSIDGYLGGDRNIPHSLFLANGRWGLVVLLKLEEKLGYFGMDVASSALILATLLYSAAAFLYARVLLTTFGATEFVIFAGLFTLHPFNTEFYTFSDATINIAVPVFLAAAGLASANTSARPRRLAGVIGGFLLLLAFSIYQLAMADAAVIALLAIVEQMTRLDAGRSTRVYARQLLDTPAVHALAVFGTAVVLYLISAVIVLRIYGLELAARADPSTVFDLEKKAIAFATAVYRVIHPIPGLLPPVPRDILIGLIVLASGAIVVSIWRRCGFLAALAGGSLIVAAAVCSVIIPVAGREIWLVPRVLSPFSIFIAGVAVLGWRTTPKLIFRAAFAGAIATLVIAFVGASNRILYDQRRTNLWDMQQANRIVARLEREPHFNDLHALAIVNGSWARSAGVPTVVGDLNISAFGGSMPTKLGVVEQATGLRFASPSGAELQAAQRYCASSGAWPAHDSVAVVERLGIVCLPLPP